MLDRIRDYEDPPARYSDVIQRTIAEWSQQQTGPLSFPLSDAVVGKLAKMISRSLVHSGLIDAKFKKRNDAM